MFIQINDSAGNPIKDVRVVLAVLGRLNPDGTAESDDKITREGGNCAWTWYPRSADNPGGKYELRVNTYEPLAAYGSEVRTVTEQQLEGAQQVFTLAAAGHGGTKPVEPAAGLSTVTCPTNSKVKGSGTVAEWKAIAHAIVDRLGLGIMEPDAQNGGNGEQPNLRAFDAAVKEIHPGACLQFDSGGELKPRLFMPSDKQDGKGPPESACGQYSRPVDFGDFGYDFFCNAISTDEWVTTGRTGDW